MAFLFDSYWRLMDKDFLPIWLKIYAASAESAGYRWVKNSGAASQRSCMPST